MSELPKKLIVVGMRFQEGAKELLRKVKEYENIARLGYKAIPVSKSTAQAAKERGSTVVQGNRIIGPATNTFRSRLKKGLIT